MLGLEAPGSGCGQCWAGGRSARGTGRATSGPVGGVVDLREGLRKSAAWAPRTKGSTLGFVLGGRREGLAFGTGVVWAPGSRAGLRVKAELSPPCAVKGKVPGGAPCAVTPARGPEHD